MALPLRNARIRLPQGQIFWREVGQGSTIIFLHGSWEDSGQWLPVIERLSADYHCLAPDLLGFGESEQPNVHYAIDLEVACLAEHLDALRLRRVYLVGHSLGGWIAVSYALKYLEQVEGVVLLAPEGVEGVGLRRRWWKARLLKLLVVGWVLRSLHSLRKILKLRSLEQLLQKRRQLLDCPVACKLLFQRRRAELRSEQLQEQLKWLKVPVLVLQGAQDTPIARLLNQTYAQLAPDAALQRLPSTSSQLLETQPDAVAQAIRGFVEERLKDEG
ncbi:alpha/beta fold hydrolase [Stenomitos frigidus]|uniref:Alpha/beta hydrolase n=1 Tax=Stenomitos frigidus ULC18 TaxID=2107698 RepID=A0A2T1DTS5_9CYAN|nr:alpha/beta hydrolase [Stenomitos frigidus]PSB23774.1 alpha/beta hydrolase [Stenomitos frigidus ULC18]